jgi:hypothetical protein
MMAKLRYSELYYSGPNTSWKELILFIVIEFFVVVCGYGTWDLISNPYQQVAVVYCWASVVITLVLHIFRELPYRSIAKLIWGYQDE